MALLVGSCSMLVMGRPARIFPAPIKPSCRRRPCIVSASIGFSTDPQIQIEKAAGGLLKDVAALLVYQEVFRSSPAQAFLKLLLVLRRRDDELKIFEAYGEFVRLMASGHHPSWEDYLLEAILKAEGNVFAEAAAGVGIPSSSYGGEIPASLEAAAIADLESLQRLSVNESTLTGWVTELVSETKPEWRAAASSNLSCRAVPKVTSSNNQKPRVMGFALTDTEPEIDEKPMVATDNEKRVVRKETDFVISEREEWQRKVGGLWKWSEAVPLLKQYYASHGFGRVAMSQVVRWKTGKLVPDFQYLKASPAGPDLSVLSKQRSELMNCLESSVSRTCSPRHVFVHGSHGSGKSWLLRSTLFKLSQQCQFRLVILPSTEIKQLATILEELKRNLNLSFIILVEDLFLRAAEESYLLLKALLDEHLQDWPENVLLCATSSRSEAKIGDAAVKLADIFRDSINLPNLEEHHFLQCVNEMVAHKSETGTRRELVEQEAVQWGRKAGLNLKSAAQFVYSDN